ncbi:MAG: PD-(D/E)XK nuclease family protein, partial [Pirellulales bacterium]|nr:PD-(D/E)XK nuclease family protein [Pirellulales bacterium]
PAACASVYVPNTLIQALAKVCRERLLEEKWLVVPSTRVGHQWLQGVARTGQPAVNVRLKTLRSMAIDLAGFVLAEQGLTLLSPLAGTVMIQQLIAGGSIKLQYLGQNAGGWSTAELLYGSLNELRMAGIEPADLDEGRIDPPAKAVDLRRLYELYLAALRQARRIDLAGLMELARDRLVEGDAAIPPNTLLLIPADLEMRGLARAFIEAFRSDMRLVLPVDALPDEASPWAVSPEEASPRAAAADEPSPGAAPALPDEASSGAGPARAAERSAAAAAGGLAAQVEADRELLCWIHRPPPVPRPAGDGTLKIVRAVGEVNEVRQVFRWCLANRVPLDQVELLYTDAQTYIPLVYEELAAQYGTLDLGSLPVTFAEGLACRFSRPGRLLRLWLQWVQEDFPQGLLQLMIQDGLLIVPWPAEISSPDQSYSRLARRLARLGVGLGRDRYVRVLREYAASLQHSQPPGDEQAPAANPTALALQQADVAVLLELAQGLLELLPPQPSGKDLLAAAERLLGQYARCISQLDNFAVGRLRQEIQQFLALLGEGDALFDVPRYLERLLEAEVQGSGPRPGAVHVASLNSGGHTGRPYTWVLGLDDSRFPGAGLQDPLLLDSDRRGLSTQLGTSQGRIEEKLRRFAELGARLRGTLTLSYSTLALADNRQLFPSPVLLAAFRLLAECLDGDIAALEAWLPEPPAAFVPRYAEECLSAGEWWQWRLLSGGGTPEEVRHAFPHLQQGAWAATERSSPAFTDFDGNVPAAGPLLDLTAADRIVSATELQMVGHCPLRFFFRFGLGIRPPDELELDAGRWLDPLSAGQLLHTLFEQFMREVIEADRLPDAQQDLPRLLAMLDDLIGVYRAQQPPASEAAYRRQVSELRETARNFLLEECRYLRSRSARPVWMEAALGLPKAATTSSIDTPEPIPIVLADGRRLRVRGRIDRIDRLRVAASSKGTSKKQAVCSYCIWDYKTGGTSSYDRADPFQQGRNIQPYLYLTMVAHRLREVEAARSRVESFGFFFPGVHAAGDRMEWPSSKLASGQEIVTQLCQVVSQGTFLPTDQHEDCTYCDYLAVCGDVAAVTAASRAKLDAPGEPRLDALRQLRPPKPAE